MCVCVSEVPTTTSPVTTTGINTNTNAPCRQLTYHNQRWFCGRSRGHATIQQPGPLCCFDISAVNAEMEHFVEECAVTTKLCLAEAP